MCFLISHKFQLNIAYSICLKKGTIFDIWDFLVICLI